MPLELLIVILSQFQNQITAASDSTLSYSQIFERCTLDSQDKLMIAVSGIRGIIGKSLTPEVVLIYVQAYGAFASNGKIVVVRDSRVTGEMMQKLVVAGLMSVGSDVIDIGIVPTPTTQMAVEKLDAQGGIVITASHNPIEWNALKLLAHDGLFLDAEQGETVGRIAASCNFTFATWETIGHTESYEFAVKDHLNAIEKLHYISTETIQKRKFSVVIDCCHGAGGVILPDLCERFGCQTIFLNREPNGLFPRNPEPSPENLTDLCNAVIAEKADIGFAVDPDVDRLAIVDEKGRPLGEEYTLALAANFILSKHQGDMVANVSTTKALDDIAALYNSKVIRTKVGEIHVAKRAREINAILAGEGNGGVILPDLHLGRDAPLGIALTLQQLSEYGGTISALYDSLPQYKMVKDRVVLPANTQPTSIVDKIKEKYRHDNLDLTDGVKILYDNSWIHIRPSNTEPIIRVMAEAPEIEDATKLVSTFKTTIMSLL